MKKVSLYIIAFAFLVTALVAGMPSSFAATTYSNFVLDHSGGDTYCLKSSDGWFYLYYPHGQKVWCYKSKDLVIWTYIGEIYSNVNQPNYGGEDIIGLYAPEVHEVNGNYYMYYVQVCTGGNDPNGTGNKDIVVVPGTSPTSFDESQRKVLIDGNNAFLDPTLFQDTNGKLYLYYKFRGVSGTGSELRVRPMSDPLNFSAEAVDVLRSEDMPGSLGPGQMEHPHVETKEGTGNYVLFFSYGDGSSTDDAAYKVCYAKATNPMGPWTLSSANPIMYSGQNPGVLTPGATSGVRDGDNKLWMVYRQKKDTGTARDLVTCIERCIITDAGNVIVEATRNQTLTAPVPLP